MVEVLREWGFRWEFQSAGRESRRPVESHYAAAGNVIDEGLLQIVVVGVETNNLQHVDRRASRRRMEALGSLLGGKQGEAMYVAVWSASVPQRS